MSATNERASRVRSKLIDRVARVDLRVRDVDAALLFYRDVVGLQVAEQDSAHAQLRSPGGPVLLTLDSTGVTAPADPRATGLFHTAIRLPTRTTLGEALARLAEAGLEIGAGDHLVSEALYVDDRDGNGVELYWDRPEDQWPPPTSDMMVPMATLPVDLEGLLAEGSGRAAIEQAAPTGTDVGHVHLQVSDIDATRRFYGEEMGLDVTASLGASAGFFSSNGYHHNIGANTWRSRGSKLAGRERAGLERVVLAVKDPEELDGLRDRMARHGREASGEDGGTVVVRDPDGIELNFVSE